MCEIRSGLTNGGYFRCGAASRRLSHVSVVPKMNVLECAMCRGLENRLEY